MKKCLSNCRVMVCCNSLAFRRFSYQARMTSSEAKFPSRRLDCIFYDPQHKLFFYTIYFQYQSLFYGTNINSVLWHKTLTDYCSATLDIVMLWLPNFVLVSSCICIENVPNFQKYLPIRLSCSYGVGPSV